MKTISAQAMIEVAVENGWIEKGNIGGIAEFAILQRRATDYCLKTSIEAMDKAMEEGDPSSGIDTMRMICAYLFAKSVESVMLWADSSDGKIDIEYRLADLDTRRYITNLEEKRSKVVIDTMPHGALLFDAHYENLADRLMRMTSPNEAYVHSEMREALEWTQRIAVAYAIRQGYQVNGGR